MRRTFSNVGGILGLLTFIGLVGTGLTLDRASEWPWGESPLATAAWVLGVSVSVLLLAMTPIRGALPVLTLGMWVSAAIFGSLAAAALFLVRGHTTIAWQALVLAVAAWISGHILEIPHRALAAARNNGATPSSLIEAMAANPDMTGDDLRNAMFDQFAFSSQVLEQIGARWPERDDYGNPKLTAEILIWDETSEEWVRASLEATLSPVVMTAEPNISLRVTPRDGSMPPFGSQTVHLRRRPDIDTSIPTYELRWIGPSPNYAKNQTVIASPASSVQILETYLESSWEPAMSSDDPPPFLTSDSRVYPRTPPAAGPQL